MEIIKQSASLEVITSRLVEVARLATCKRSKCGSVIVLDGVIIGEGYNSMPCDVIADCFKDNLAETFKSVVVSHIVQFVVRWHLMLG
jgi:deoxycytidylate deaminase